MDTKNVVCIKWGSPNYYSAKYVNNLYRAVIKNTKYKIDFYCFTDNSDNFDPDIIVKPLPTLKNLDKVGCEIYQKEAGLCDNNLGGLKGQRVLYFDLDTIIVGNLDSFFELPKGNEFCIIKDWSHRDGSVGQASCYSWTVGTLGYIKNYFEAHYDDVYKKFTTASQEYLSSKIIEKCGKLNFWPESWCRSFKLHCLPTPLIPFLRKFKVATIPEDAKILCFHGRPKIEDALTGLWPERSWYKRFFYKHLKPVKWLERYWGRE
ncbi:hypothetical protein FACS1894152_7320 [Bacilli bacterium]|nr:hypothetical protein FACS1894152_7320 [Bacilli bacterium]